MDLQLRYLIIVRPNGIPIYSQSFDFDIVFACQTFNNRLSEMGEKKELLSGYFNAIKDILTEVIQDKLQVIHLGFQSYRMTGIVFDDFLYIGIFEVSHKKRIDLESEILTILRKIVNRFTNKYEQALLDEDFVDLAKYEDFTKDLLELRLPFSLDKCRNCLTECVEEDMGCLPHIIYFQREFHTSRT